MPGPKRLRPTMSCSPSRARPPPLSLSFCSSSVTPADPTNSPPGPDRCTMDRLHKISAEIIRLYRQQLNLWVLGRIADLKDADLLQYDRMRERLEQLGKELETLAERRG